VLSWKFCRGENNLLLTGTLGYTPLDQLLAYKKLTEYSEQTFLLMPHQNVETSFILREVRGRWTNKRAGL